MSQSYSYEATSGSLTLDARKAAYLPNSKTLLVADLHFEKGSYLQMVGNSALPLYDTADTMDRLNHVIDAYCPNHVVALGDSFHDEAAGDRLSKETEAELNALIKRLQRFTWILGNHDPDIPKALKGQRQDHLEVDGFLLTHLPTRADAGQTNICGHLHPKAKVSVRRRRISHPCFACSDSRIILPSFGAYTGGLFVDHPAIKDELGGNEIYALTTPSGIYPVR